jgi:hypothetical protein
MAPEVSARFQASSRRHRAPFAAPFAALFPYRFHVRVVDTEAVAKPRAPARINAIGLSRLAFLLRCRNARGTVNPESAVRTQNV